VSYDIREEQRVFNFCVYRQGDEKPMQCFETADEAQAYWMALNVADVTESSAESKSTVLTLATEFKKLLKRG
jgi:dsDNA-binding SOS-regulon protein